jgi:hypothetical protein
MGKSKLDSNRNFHAQLDVLVTPSCDAKNQIVDLLGWGTQVLAVANRFTLNQASSALLQMETANIQPGLWTELFQDADVDPSNTPATPTPIAPHGVSLSMSHDLCHGFYESALSRPIDPASPGVSLDFLRSLHSNAATNYGLYVPSATVPPPGPRDSDDQDAAAVLASIAGAPEAADADTLIRSRFGVDPPTLNQSTHVMVPMAIQSSGGKSLQPPKKANHALAHLKLHLTNSLKAASNQPFETLPKHPRPDHLLYHVNRLISSRNDKGAAGAMKVAQTVLARKPYSFNRRITLLLNMPAVLEALGLLLHFKLSWDVATLLSTVQIDIPPELKDSRIVIARTTCCNENFLPKPNSSAIRPNGWLEPTDGYKAGSLQLDSAAMQITQFANQAGLRQASDPTMPPPVTVSYDEDVDHPSLPPSPHTGGFQVWQEDLQTKTIDHRKNAVANANDPTNLLYAEDLRNGTVVDILAKNPERPGDTGSWIHLCLRNEEFDIGRFRVTAKGVDRSVKTSAAQSSDPSIESRLSYDVDETIFTWKLGSLVAKSKLVTKPGIQSGTPIAAAHQQSQRIPWGNLGSSKLEEVEATPSPLFGWIYLASLRAGFVNGGVVAFNESDATSAALPAQPFQRYELVDGPALIPVLLTDHYLAHQSPTRMFVGSRIQDDLSIHAFAELSQRVIVPAQVTPEIARRHGKPEDLIQQGATVFPLQNGSLPKEIINPNAPQPISSGIYLPDPLCTGVVAALTDPEGKVLATKSLDFYSDDDAAWPNYVPHMIELQSSDGSQPSLDVDDITSAPGAFPFLKQGLSKAFVCKVPPGETFLLVLRPLLDPTNINNVHAFSLMTQAGITPNTLDVAKLTLSDICRPTTVRLTHATDRPFKKPVVSMTPPLQGSDAVAADQRSVLLGADIDSPSTSKVALVTSWQELTDDVNQPSSTSRTLQAQLSEFSVHKTDPGHVKPAKTQFPFSDGRYRRLKVNARGTSRYGDVFGGDPQSRTLDSDPIALDLLASVAPKVPDIEYVLPNLRWQLDDKRTRTMGLTVILNRPWFSSGCGEQLAIITAPCTDPKGQVVDSIAASFSPNAENNVSAWGVLADWLPFIPKGAGTQGIKIATDSTAPAKDNDQPIAPAPLDSYGVVTIGGTLYWALFYVPRFNDQDQQWFVNFSFSSPPAYGAVVRLLMARYQKYAAPNLQLSDVSMCDFALLRPDRAVSITTKWEGLKRTMQVQILGVSPRVPEGQDVAALPRTLIEVRHFDTDQEKPPVFDWKAGDIVVMDQNLPTTGNILWQATFPYPWLGGQLVAQEWEVWPTAEDPTQTSSLPVYCDIFPI